MLSNSDSSLGEGERAVVADDDPSTSCFSSLRVHCVIEVSSLGHGTRLNFALRNVNQRLVSGRPCTRVPGVVGVLVPVKAPFAALL